MPKVQTAASSNANSLSSAGPYYCFLQHWPLGFVEAPLGGVADLCGIASVGYTVFSEKTQTWKEVLRTWETSSFCSRYP